MIASVTALSGLTAQTARVDVAAANLANQHSRGALPGPGGGVPAGQPAAYQGATVDTVARTAGGTAPVYRTMTPAVLAAYDPQASYANAQGQVAVPNVDSARDILTLKSASAAYKSNLAVIKTTDEMTREVLHLTA